MLKEITKPTESLKKKNKLQNTFANLFNWSNSPANFIAESLGKLKDLTHTNYNLGLYHLRQGNINDAKLRFRMVLFLSPNHLEATYRLAYCSILLNKLAQAETLLHKCLSIEPNYAEAKYLLATINSSIIKPEEIPTSILEEYFDDLANEYTRNFVEKFDYQGNEALYDLFAKIIPEHKQFDNVLDVGCGTGLTGVYFKERLKINHLHGIDISNSMLAEAKLAKINDLPTYEHLIRANYNDYLKIHNHTYDLIISAYSLTFSPYLLDNMVAAALLLNNNGVLVFSVERSTGKDMEWSKNMQNFCYSTTYIEKAAQKAGFMEVKVEEVKIHNKSMGFQFIGKKK